MQSVNVDLGALIVGGRWFGCALNVVIITCGCTSKWSVFIYIVVILISNNYNLEVIQVGFLPC